MPSVNNFGLPSSYKSRPQPDYFVDSSGQPDSDVVWQPDVYNTVAKLAKTVGAETIIDIGCGRGGKLVALKDDFKVVGIDYGSNIEFCRTEFPFGTWDEIDLESEGAELPLSQDQLSGAAIVCSDVIEHLINPLPLVHLIQRSLEHAHLAVISTPDRQLFRGFLHKGPPVNHFHVREWALHEFSSFLASEGCQILHSGVTQSHSKSDQKKTCLIVLRGAKMTDETAKRITALLPAPPTPLRYTWTVTERTIRRMFTHSGKSSN